MSSNAFTNCVSSRERVHLRRAIGGGLRKIPRRGLGRVFGPTGVDGTIRYLRNVMGLWLLQESMRTWGITDLPALLRDAANEPALRSVVNPDAPPSCTGRHARPDRRRLPARRRTGTRNP